MSEHSKEYIDKEEFRKANLALFDFQKRHNIIRKDYELLLDLTNEFKEDQKKFNTLYRTSLKGFLSLIESDLFGLNQVDPYKYYNDKHRFEDKFKKTFKQICNTWNKQEIIQNYLDSKYEKMIVIKNKRDKLVHPKTSNDLIIASHEGYEELKTSFKEYKKMIHSIMDNFFIEIHINDLSEFKDLFFNR